MSINEIIKKKHICVSQYAFETKNLDGPSEDFLEESASLIGYIVQSFNTLEEELTSLISGLFFDDDDTLGLLVTSNMTYSQKVDLFKRLLLREQEALKRTMACFNTLVQNLTDAGTLRNTVVHADWETAHPDGYTLCKVKVNSHGVQHEYVQFSIDSLNDILNLINETMDMFNVYEEEHAALLRGTT
jgi:hypothetical protein